MKQELLLFGTVPCVSTLCLPDVTTCDQVSQAFLPRTCILQVIKHWRWEGPGKEANVQETEEATREGPMKRTLYGVKWLSLMR